MVPEHYRRHELEWLLGDLSPEAFSMQPLNYDEARALTDRIREHRDQLRLEVYQAWAGRAWKALKYDSWQQYVLVEFQEHRSTIDRELQVARIEMIIDDDSRGADPRHGNPDASIGKRGKESLLPLGRLLSPSDDPAPAGEVEPTPPDRKEAIRSAYREAGSGTNGHPTGKVVQKVVDRIVPKPPKRKSLFDIKTNPDPKEADQYANWEAVLRFWNNQLLWVYKVGGILGYTRGWTLRQRTYIRSNLEQIRDTLSQWIDEFDAVEVED